MRLHRLLASSALALLLLPAAARAAPARSKLLQNGTGKTVVRKVIFNNDLSVAVISKSGTAVVCDPQNMPAGVIPDAVTISHQHHANAAYLQEAAAGKAAVHVHELGTWTAGDVRITAVPGAHATAPVDMTAHEFVVYVFDVDGLRIAYFSCEGQARLTPEQLAQLGKVDVALITAENGGGLSTARARGLMQQLGARIVVPLSHHEGDVDYNNEIMAELSGGKLETVSGELALSRADLGGAGQRVVHILPSLKP
jgi:L-ascorbate metabolism protein UlaG (beta-lactamase superfamily)